MSASCRASASRRPERRWRGRQGDPRRRAEGAGRRVRSARRALLRRRPTATSRSAPTACCAGSVRRSPRWRQATSALKPRVILLADEQLTGPARDKVAARVERFVNFQIETLLKPLVDLHERRPDLPGIGTRHRLPARREFRPAQPPRHRRGREVARPGRPRRAAPARRALRRLSHLRAGAAQAGPGRADHAALGAEERRQGQARLRRCRARARGRPHLGRRRSGLRRAPSTSSPASASSAAAPCASTSSSGWPTSSVRRSPGSRARRASGRRL